MSIIRGAALLLAFCAFAAARQTQQQRMNSPVLGADMPLYPALARQAGIEGRVEVQIRTDTDGKVISAMPLNGPGILRQVALDNAKTWRFTPKRSEGTIVYEFRIIGKADLNEDYYGYGKVVFCPPNSVEVDFPPLIMARDLPTAKSRLLA